MKAHAGLPMNTKPSTNTSTTEPLRVSGSKVSAGASIASFAVAGRDSGQELADLALEVSAGVRAIALPEPIPPLEAAIVRVEVADVQGNITRVERTFSTFSSTIFADDFETGDTSRWSF